MNTLAIIPARGGSKAIPRKNLALIAGKKLIDHTIDAAQNTPELKRIILTSDDSVIIDYCRNRGIDVPFIRPPEISDDSASMLDVVSHTLKWLQDNENYRPDIVILLQPTSPLRQSIDIVKTLDAMKEAHTESAVSVNKMQEHPFECISIKNQKILPLKASSTSKTRRQDYDEDFYFINGAVYCFTPKFIEKYKKFFLFGEETAIYEMPTIRSIDIDTPEDLKIAVALMSLS